MTQSPYYSFLNGAFDEQAKNRSQEVNSSFHREKKVEQNQDYASLEYVTTMSNTCRDYHAEWFHNDTHSLAFRLDRAEKVKPWR